MAVMGVLSFWGCGDKDKPDKPEKKLIQYTVQQSLEESFYSPRDQTHFQLDSLVQQGQINVVQVASWKGSSIYCLDVPAESLESVYDTMSTQAEKSTVPVQINFVDECEHHSDAD